MANFRTMIGENEIFHINMDLVTEIRTFDGTLCFFCVGDTESTKVRFADSNVAKRALAELLETINE